MHFEIEALGLSRYPILDAFLSASPGSPHFVHMTASLVSGDGHLKLYPYPLLQHINKQTITVYEICAALGKWEHLWELLNREDTSKVCLNRLTQKANAQDRKKFLVYELIAQAIINRRLDMIDKLFTYIDPDGTGIHINQSLHYFLRLAMLTSSVVVFARLLKYIGTKVHMDSANNFLFCQALNCGYIEIASRLFEYTEIRGACTREDKKRLLRLLVERGELAMFDSAFTFCNDNSIFADNDNELLRAAIASDHLVIVKRLLTIEEVKKAPLDRCLRLAVVQSQSTILNYLLNCLNRDVFSIIPTLMKTAAVINANDIFVLLFRFALARDSGIKDKGLLKFALRADCLPMFEKLLEFNQVKSVLLSNNGHWDMLCLAVNNDVPAIVQCLLNVPTKLANVAQSNNRLLIHAVQVGSLDIVKRLLQIKEIRNAPIHEAMLFAVRNDRLPLLEAAVEFGRKSILRKLLEMTDARESSQYDSFLLQPALRKGCHPGAILCSSLHQFFRQASEETDSVEALDVSDEILEAAGWQVVL